jgi:hypothetical protein
MRKAFYALFIALCIALQANAAAGDTTWVQAQNTIKMPNYGNYDSSVVFPSGSVTYRKIYMVFTMGEYVCPTGSQYCHQWDYTVQTSVLTPGGDTMELGRFISPYANSGTPNFPSTWTYRYIYDVTDYAAILKNAATIRILYSGYSGGFTANVKFAFVEGTPERNVLGITKLWNGGYTYGKASDPIDNHVTQKNLVAPATTQAAELKFNITGHGSDANQCCEFLSKDYHVKLNGNTTDTKSIWRNDCGSNELYPQGGTWIYNRANWCPGAIVYTNTHKLAGITGGNTYTLDVDFDAYTNTNANYGSYIVDGKVFYYGPINKVTDASLEDIIAPTDFEGHFRENPSNGTPVVTVRNTGSTAITSIQFRYGVKDSTQSTFTWTGSLAPLTETQISLPELASLKYMSLNGAAGTYGFKAQITAVNGAADNDVHNDTLNSLFTIAPTWPNVFVVYMKTNNVGENGIGSGPSETSWKIVDNNNNIIASRTNAAISTTYNDTVSMPRTGFYKLIVTDKGCDGLHWWPYDPSSNSGITAGNIVIRETVNGFNIPVHGNTYAGTFHDDFGCGFEQSFTAIGWPLGVHNSTINQTAGSILAYPNPATENLNVSLYGIRNVNGEISLIDAVGRVVLLRKTTSANNNLDLSGLTSGIYNVMYTDGGGHRLYSRITISK